MKRRIIGTTTRPRLAVFRSGQHIFAQLIDDSKGVTLAAMGDYKLKGTKTEKAMEVGKKIAEMAKKQNITEIVFDRGGFLYHGRIMKLATGAREGGLKF